MSSRGAAREGGHGSGPVDVRIRPVLWVLLGSLAAGIAAGILSAAANYHDPWRPLGHALGPWAALCFAVSFRREPRLAILGAVALPDLIPLLLL